MVNNRFEGIVKLTKQQYDELVANGSITVGGITVNYSENTLYVTDETEINNLTNRVDNLETTVNEHTNTIAENTSFIATNTSDISKLKTEKANTNDVAVISQQVNTNTGNITQLNNDIQDKADITYVDDNLANKANTLYVDEELNKKSNKTIIESIELVDWTGLTQKDPYKFQSTVTLNTPLVENSIVELFNDNAVLFSTYGLMIGDIQGQNITIYCVKQPSIAITLKIGVQN